MMSGLRAFETGMSMGTNVFNGGIVRGDAPAVCRPSRSAHDQPRGQRVLLVPLFVIHPLTLCAPPVTNNMRCMKTYRICLSFQSHTCPVSFSNRCPNIFNIVPLFSCMRPMRALYDVHSPVGSVSIQWAVTAKYKSMLLACQLSQVKETSPATP